MTRHRRLVRARRLHWAAGVLVATVLMLDGAGSMAAPGGVALVVGAGQYAGQSALPACSEAAHAVSARLRQQGFAVDEAIDGPAVSLRDALTDFAGRVATVQEPPLVYVCAEATAIDRRLFLLPSDVDLRQELRPETQGVVLRALLNAMTGTKGTLVAELAMVPGADPAPVAAALQEALPDGLHLAVAVGDGRPAGMLGQRLASDGTPLDQGWDRLAAALQGTPEGAPTAISLYEPPPSPVPAMVAAAPSPAARQEAAASDAGAAADDTAPAAAPPQAAKRTADARSGGTRPTGEDRVRRLQLALTQRGFYGGPLDGIVGARTAQAILSFQISVGDPASGRLTSTEAHRLLNNW